MEVELLVNIIILSIVGTLVIVIVHLSLNKKIAVRIYVSCCRPSYDADELWEQGEIVAPQTQVKQQELQWTSLEQSPINKKDQCPICLDRKVNTVTSCGHKFHMNCLIEWKKRMKTFCPYCKSEGLSHVTFYCQHCIKSKVSYDFEQPLTFARNHMIPNFFIEFSTNNQKRLLCPQCKQHHSQTYEQCITRNLDTVKGSRSSQDKLMNKESRNKESESRSRDPVEISIKTSPKQSREMISNYEIHTTPKQSREKNSNQDTAVTPGTPNELRGPETDGRFLVAIDY